jgi:hypothetical protein
VLPRLSPQSASGVFHRAMLFRYDESPQWNTLFVMFAPRSFWMIGQDSAFEGVAPYYSAT